MKNIFDELINYYKTEPNLLLITVIVLVACLAIAFLIIYIRALIIRNRTKKEERDALEQMKAAKEIENFDDTTFEQSAEQNDEIIDNEADEKSNSPAENEEQNSESDKTEENTATAKDESVVTESADDQDKNDNSKKEDTRYSGKWLIKQEDNRFLAELLASNGEILLRTESYSALSGIKSGIETVKNNIAKDNIAVSLDKNGNFFFKVYSSSTRLLCVSEGYSTKASCERAVDSVKRFSKTAIVTRYQQPEEQN